MPIPDTSPERSLRALAKQRTVVSLTPRAERRCSRAHGCRYWRIERERGSGSASCAGRDRDRSEPGILSYVSGCLSGEISLEDGSSSRSLDSNHHFEGFGNPSVAIHYRHDWHGQHLIVRKVQPSGIAWVDGESPSRAAGGNLSYSACRKRKHHLIPKVSTATGASNVTRLALSRLQRAC